MLYIWIPLGVEQWRYCIQSAPIKGVLPIADNASDWKTANNLEDLLNQTSSVVSFSKPSTKNNKKVKKTEAIVFFPSIKSQCVQKEMADKQYKKLGDIGLRYVLEEYSLTPIDLLEIRQTRSQIDTLDYVDFLAVSQQDTANYMQILSLGNWQIQALLPDFLLLPNPSSSTEATLYIDASKRLMRINNYTGFDCDELATVLPRLPSHINTINLIGEPTASDLNTLNSSGLNIVNQAKVLTSGSDINMRHPFNMLLAPQQTNVPKYYKAIAATLLMAVGTQMLYDGIRLHQNKQMIQTVRAQSETYYKQWFPGEHIKAGLGLQKQVKSHLKSSNGNSTAQAITLMSRVAPILSQNTSYATSVSFSQNALDIAVSAPNMQTLDILKSQLTDQGLTVALGEANAKGNAAVGMLHVQI